MHPPIDSAGSADLSAHAAMVLLVDDQVMVAEAIRRALVVEGNIDFHY
ncbi:MAG: diguanylate cyclase response regulator, partial [Achromobacter spanius]